MSSETFFVWIYLPEETTPVVAGRLDIRATPSGAVGEFVYGQSYLARPDAIPIDPVGLPLNNSAPPFTSLSGFPGVILDACPDRWGIAVIDRLLGQKTYPAGYLLMNDPGRAGNLAFSLAAGEPPQELESREFPLAELLGAAVAVETGQPVDPELLRALHPGTGGARPKCNIIDGDAVWIAKFPSVKDSPLVSIPRLEHATMRLGQEWCGIECAETRLKVVDGKDVCLVRRFDRKIVEGEVLRKGYLSARTVFYADPAYAAVATGSYGRFARWGQRFGCTAEDRRQLFRRMVFNCAVRNADDHELNHGLIHVKGGEFRLSQAFDIVPTLVPHEVHRHALLIGDSASGTVTNLVSNANAFGIHRDEALAIIADIQAAVAGHWRETFYEAGFGEEELRRIEHVFWPIPIDVPAR
jgi:serine/threonine-protein kinase HipA